MKVYFKMEDLDGDKLPKATSSVVEGGLDIYELLLSGDLSSIEKINEFEKTVFKNRSVWWFNATKVEVVGEMVSIKPAFDMPAEISVNINSLKMLVKEWRLFLGDHQPRIINV